MDTEPASAPPAATGLLTVTVLSPDAVVFEGTAKHILAPSHDIVLGIMAGHTPMFAEIVAGTLLIQGEMETAIPVDGGMLKIIGDAVTILVIPEKTEGS